MALFNGKIFVDYEKYYDYLDNPGFSRYSSEGNIFYSGSEGLVYTGIKMDGTKPSSDADIEAHMIGTGTTSVGNGYTSAFNGVLLGIPKYYEHGEMNIIRIGGYAFYNCLTLQRVTIPDTVTYIGDFAFYGCSNLKFVILNGKRALQSAGGTIPAISANTFANNAGDRIFVVPDGERENYIAISSWETYASLIIEWSEYEAMMGGSGFTHFVLAPTEETTIQLNIAKSDNSTMTIVWGDGTSEEISASKTIAAPHQIKHMYSPGEYTLSIIARGPWVIGKNVQLLGGTLQNSYLKEAYFDNNYYYVSEIIDYSAAFTETVNTTLFSNCTQLEILHLPTNYTAILSGYLRDCASLKELRIPFTGTNINYNETERHHLLGRLFSTDQMDSAKYDLISQKYGDADDAMYAAYVPRTLETVKVAAGTGVQGGTSSGRYIPNGAFAGFPNLVNVELPNTIFEISDYAFYNCTSLVNINLANSIKTIGKSAFANCTVLEITSLPNTLTAISDRTFYQCQAIRPNNIPSTVTTIGAYAFYGCRVMSPPSIPENVTSIGEYAFYNCELVPFSTIPAAIMASGNLEAGTFGNCLNVTFSEIPSTMTEIPDELFRGCEKAKFTSVPSGLTYIGNYAFSKCKNIAISNIPDTVSFIGNYAFDECSGVTITKLPSAPNLIVGEYAFAECKNITISALPNNIKTIESLEGISAGAFKNCTGLTLSAIPSTVSTIGDYAFYGCTNIIITTIPETVTYLGKYAFYGCSNIRLTAIPSQLTEVQEYCFAECPNVSVSKFSSGISYIGQSAFYHTNVPSFIYFGTNINKTNIISKETNNLNKYLPNIGQNAFVGSVITGCRIRVYSDITSSDVSIGVIDWGLSTSGTNTIEIIPITTISSEYTNIFTYDSYERPDNHAVGIAITGINISSNSYDYIDTLLGNYDHTLIIPDTIIDGSGEHKVYAIVGSAFSSTKLTKTEGGTTKNYAMLINEIVFSDAAAIYEIGFEAFKGFPATSEFNFPNSVCVIGNSAFEGSMLHISSIGPSVSHIGEKAFAGCGRFTASILPSSVITVGHRAFDSNTLTSIHAESCNSLASLDFSGYVNRTVSSIYLPTRAPSFENFILENKTTIGDEEYNQYFTMVLKFRISESDKNYTLINAGKDDSGFNIFVVDGVHLYVGNFMVFDQLKPNIDYALVIRANNTDEVVRSSVLIATNDPDLRYSTTATIDTDYSEYNRYAFGYVHYNDGIDTYNLYDFAIPDTTASIYSLTIYVNGGYPEAVNVVSATGEVKSAPSSVTDCCLNLGICNDGFLRKYESIYTYTIPSNADARFGEDKCYPYITSGNTIASETTKTSYMLNQTTWAEIMAFAREGYFTPYTANAVLAFNGRLSIDVDWSGNTHLFCVPELFDSDNAKKIDIYGVGEAKAVNLIYPEGSAYVNCTDDEEKQGTITNTAGDTVKVPRMPMEIISMGTDVSENLGYCPLTFGCLYLLPNKSSLYSSSHYMRDVLVTMGERNPIIVRKDDKVSDDYYDSSVTATKGGRNATTVTFDTNFDNTVDKENGKETISVVTTEGGEAESFEVGYVWIIANEMTTISKVTTQIGDTTFGYNFNSSDTNMHANFRTVTSEVGAENITTSNIILFRNTEYLWPGDKAQDGFVYLASTGALSPTIKVPNIIIDATCGIVERQTASECIILTPGAKIGIPVTPGGKVNITYYQSWNLSGWRDCTVRAACNNHHYNALESSVKPLVETVIKDTNVGGLHTVINRTVDKCWLYSLSEAGMYSNTDPYMYEGAPFTYYLPSVTDNGGRSAVRKKYVIADEANYTYWWLRTPDMYTYNHPSGLKEFWGYYIGSYGYPSPGHGLTAPTGVCFGLSTLSPDRPRAYYNRSHLQSTAQLPFTAAGACSRLTGMTHVFSFIADSDVDAVGSYIDMRYPLDSSDSGMSGGYNVTISGNGNTGRTIKVNNTTIYDNVSDSDLITMVITQDSIEPHIKQMHLGTNTDEDVNVTTDDTSAHIYVWKNKILVVDDDFNGLGNDFRTYSISPRLGMVLSPASAGTMNGYVATCEVINKRLSLGELQSLHSLKYHNWAL